ncbi:MAG: ATP-binding domain-containing protein, partial [Bacteroidaceae bacterium]|nr:ATP-binding domain-containing protein [Bacteroidaceae bacterium]
YIYNGQSCRMLLVGDTAQLPPVGESESPALDAHVVGSYGLQVYSAELSDVVRQKNGGGILWNATRLRQIVADGGGMSLPKIKFDGFADIVNVRGDQLIESLAENYHKYGLDDTIVITRSNKRANIYNQGIRKTVLDYEDELASGDMLMIAKNNYFWTQKDNFIANGEIAILRRFRRVRDLYGFRFADVEIELPDRNNEELSATVLLDTLCSESPSLTPDEQEKLFNAVLEDYNDIPLKSDKLKEMRKSEYFNALQIKYAYAVTCHKAQGGQWSCVYVDQGYMTDDMLAPDYFRWLYTAFTRATDKLFLVNWPKEQTL